MNDQRDYFNDVSHQYRTDLLINTPMVQALEMQDLQANFHKKSVQSILDFGAGNGRVTFWFLQLGHNVTAIDISSRSLSDIRALYAKHKKPSWGILQTKTSLPHNTRFDVVVGADILHHVDIKKLLPQLKTVLKPHGRIVFSEPNAWHIPWYIHYARKRIPWHMERGILQCTYRNLYHQFACAGFQDIHIKGHGLLPTPLISSVSSLCKINALSFGDAPFFRGIAFRYIISATNG